MKAERLKTAILRSSVYNLIITFWVCATINFFFDFEYYNLRAKLD